MRKALGWVPAVLSFVAACGPNNDLGFYASGSIQATVTDPAGGDPTQSGFRFQQTTRIDPSLPAGATGGVTGVCQVGPDGRSVRLTHVPGDGRGVREVSISMPAWDDDACTDCSHGRIQVTLGSTVFSGEELRGGAGPSACTFQASRRGSFGMQLEVQCAGLSAQGDARTMSVTGSLTLDECDGPETRNR